MTPIPPHKRRGAFKPAGMGYSTVLPDADFETFSAAGYLWDADKNKWASMPGAASGKKGLGVVAAPAYAQHPSTEVLSLAYDLKVGAGPQLWLPGMPNPKDLFDYLASGGLLEAWNVGFERLIWTYVCVPRYGWPPLPTRQLRCAMAKARAHGLPGKLAIAGSVLNLDVQKDKEGEDLIKLFCMPRNPTKPDPRTRIRLSDDPIKADSLIRYNITDIKAEEAISAVCPDLTGEELEFWLADQAINERGVHIDLPGVENCIAIIHQAHDQYNAELRSLTGGAVQRASEVQKLKKWLLEQGCEMEGLTEDEVTERLDAKTEPPEHVARMLEIIRQDKLAADAARVAGLPHSSIWDEPDPSMMEALAWRAAPPLAPQAKRALEIRQAVGSASVKKVFAMKLQVCADERLRELFAYHGARTGRCIAEGQLVWTDRGPVPIERVQATDMVWDGVEWVEHNGVIFSGDKPVLKYEGLTATPDHHVFVDDVTCLPLGSVAAAGISLHQPDTQ